MYCHVEIPRGGTTQAGLALSGQPDALAILDTGRDPHIDCASAGRHARAFALLAGVLDDRAAATAFGARFGEPERTLIAADHTGPVAVRADLWAGARTCPAAMAIRARRRAGEPQRHRHALGGLHERQLGFGLQIVAAARPARARLRATAEQSAEQVADVRTAGLPGRVEQVVQVELGAIGTESAEVVAVEAAPAESAAREQPSGFVVFLALSRIRQHTVRLGHRLESLGGTRLGVGVGMKIAGQLPVGPLDLVGAGVRGDAELLVEVLFDPFALGHTASPPYLSSGSSYDSAASSARSSPLSGVSAASSASGTVSTTPTRAWRTT